MLALRGFLFLFFMGVCCKGIIVCLFGGVDG